MVTGCKSFTGPWPSGESVDYRDPVQKGIYDATRGWLPKNCSLMAALSAYAWVCPTWINKSSLTFTFYDRTTRQPVTKTVTKDFWMDDANNFIFARSKNAGEIWPALYEKAYAKWKTSTDVCNMTAMDQALWPGNGHTALLELSNWRDNTAVNKSPYSTASFTSGAAIYAKIKEFGMTPTSTATQVRYPAVAWTTAGNLDREIYKDHAYTILGVYTKNNIQYIVLRNPRGMYSGAPPGGIVDTATSYSPVTLKTCCSNCSNPVTVTTSGSFDLTNGTFALKIDSFKTLFTAFAFVGRLI